MVFLAEAGLHEQAEPLFRHWEALGQEDLAAAGDDAGFLKAELAEEREYHRRDQIGREKRASGEAAAMAAEAAAGGGRPPGAFAGSRPRRTSPFFFT